jgi:glycine hydroxymethyltransferase
VLVDLGMDGLNGKEAEDRLAEVGITVNRNAIPFDQRPPMQASGLRIGTPALTTRGMQEDDLREIGRVVCAALDGGYDDTQRDELNERTRSLVERYPLYPSLATAAV